MLLFLPLGTFCTLFLPQSSSKVPRAEKLKNFQGRHAIMGYSRKKLNIKQGGGVEGIQYPGVLKKEHMEIPWGQLKKKWNFQG